MDMKLEVLVIPVSDVDRAKAFYEEMGFRLDIDYSANDKFRVLQFTPPGSKASIIFGKGITSAKPGSIDHLVLAVDDVDAARGDLVKRGVNVSEVFHYASGPFNNVSEKPRVSGRDPQNRSYYSFASFSDPDGNGWLLQEIKERLPGRV
jgi:catechol 2,3-dioxygenase-like lactoylglutathione lyase family enzyme